MLFFLPAKMKNPTLKKLTAALTLLALALAGAACKSGYPVSAKNAADGKEPRAVKTAQVSEIPMERAVTVSGTLAAQGVSAAAS